MKTIRCLWIIGLISIVFTTEAVNWQAVEDDIEILELSGRNLSAGAEETAFLKALGAYKTRSEEALALAGAFLSDYPSSVLRAKARLIQANIFFFKGDYAKALDLYSEIPEDAFSGYLKQIYLYRKSYSLLRTGYFDEARAGFTLLAKYPDFSVAALFYDAYIDYVNGNYPDARRKFSMIGSEGEKGLESEYYLLQMDYNKGEFESVAKKGEKLLKNVPEPLKSETLRVTGLANFKLGRKDKAEKLIDLYLACASEPEVSALYTRGVLHYDKGETELAEAMFSKTTEENSPVAQSSWLYLGQIYLTSGDPNAASTAFDKAYRMAWDPSVSETALFNLSITAAEGGTVPFQNSVELLEQFVSRYPDSGHIDEVSRLLASAYYNNRDYYKALQAIEKADLSDPINIDTRQKIYFELGKDSMIEGDIAEAIDYLAKATDKGSDRNVRADAFLWLGDAYYAEGNFYKAEKSYLEALKTGDLGANTAQAQYNLGYSLFKQKKYSQAAMRLRDALADNGLQRGSATDARLRLADCLYYTGKYADALEEFHKAAASASNTEKIYAEMRQADILAATGDIAGEIKILERLRNQNTGIRTKDILVRLGDAYSVAGRDAEAGAVYSELLEGGSGAEENAQLYYSLASNAARLFENGDYAAAYPLYEKIAGSKIPELYPDALIGLMRTSDSPAQVKSSAAEVMQMSGLKPEVTEEASFIYASSQLHSENPTERREAEEILGRLALRPERGFGSLAALDLAEYYLDSDNLEKAEALLSDFIDSGADGGHNLALGYIMLADVYRAQKKTHLAKMYLETLRENYGAADREINEMIDTRLKTLKK